MKLIVKYFFLDVLFLWGSFLIWIIHFSLSDMFCFLGMGWLSESSCIQVSRVYVNVRKMKFCVIMVIQSYGHS